MKKKSKFEEMMEKAGAKIMPKFVQEGNQPVPDDMMDLIYEKEPEVVIESTLSISESTVTEPVQLVEEIKVEPVKEVNMDIKYAYNIYLNSKDKSYYKDILQYQGDNLLSIKTERLTVSQALAMVEAKKIFTNKLILKKEKV